MAAPTKKIFTVGLNIARVYALNTSNLMAATSLTAYDGIAIGGPVSFSYEPADPQSIVHPGNNTVLQRDVLPSQDVASGILEVSRADYDTLALLSNIKVNVIGEANAIGWGNNMAGTEPTVALVLYAQGKLPSGSRAWQTYVLPTCIIVPKPKGMSREQKNLQYFVQPQNAIAHLTGLAFTVANDGYTSAEVNEYQSNYRMHFTSWKTTTSSAAFTLAASYPMVSTAGLTVYKDGVVMTPGAGADSIHYTATTTVITFGANVLSGSIISAQFEMDNADNDLD